MSDINQVAEFTEYVRIIRHSLGLDHFKKPYRNYFSTHTEATNYNTITQMAKLELLEEYQKTNNYTYYRVTEKGMRLIGYKKEFLGII
jgi:DNA-binding PadR family transcriptional regulator